jgi:hypothetical protein
MIDRDFYPKNITADIAALFDRICLLITLRHSFNWL